MAGMAREAAMRQKIRTAIISFAAIASISAAVAQQGVTAQKSSVDLGKFDYEAKCATCHGSTGKGDGPMAPGLKKTPADLTKLAKSNGGVLPVMAIYDTILGDKSIPEHRVMPMWGTEFRTELRESGALDEVPYDHAGIVRARVLAIIDFINRLQIK